MAWVTYKDLDEMTRLILLEDEPPKRAHDFVQALRNEYPDVSLIEAVKLWTKYNGLDRQRPTHDIETGKRL